jgi:hypothetical protein
MENQRASEQQAVQLLRQWDVTPASDKRTIFLLLPGYLCNQWYQVGEPYGCYAEALSFLDTLIDRSRTAKQLPS